VTAVTPENRTFDPAHLTRVLDGRYATVREDIRTVMRRPEFAPVVALRTAEYRERVLGWAKALSAALTREVNRLCNETRLCAGRLVDAFGIPDEVLAAPIGLSDGAEAM